MLWERIEVPDPLTRRRPRYRWTVCSQELESFRRRFVESDGGARGKAGGSGWEPGSRVVDKYAVGSDDLTPGHGQRCPRGCYAYCLVLGGLGREPNNWVQPDEAKRSTEDGSWKTSPSQGFKSGRENNRVTIDRFPTWEEAHRWRKRWGVDAEAGTVRCETEGYSRQEE
ncbi:hypothetical protein BO70DRAFT_360695 [Aspergillus heteromorphus CBS 117.55]|uniref:Uncharacterized protein n=1 Tax=Aspergillus heteromorphus CBS 117.55 TaxID=1448321 RepID=A0A317WLR1_9EURO|nr:uncharacterized protein BO70DRAFT_360695 [Aspergillus heteromorphus CBS 117.55]PWY86965.1 hypothetical protein BO70DRAFT_360695 [Aspergillus heteromorphus CBS 117.55]